MSEDEDIDGGEHIGWYYRIVGFVLLAGAIGIAVFKVVKEKEFSVEDIGLIGGFLFASLITIRPQWMDKNFKSILDAIPFVKYTKPKD